MLRRWAADETQLHAWLRRRVDGEPLEHIVGRVEFGGLDLHVGAGVFVPRQRSQVLASVAADLVSARSGPFVEACCGVGPIAAVVAREHPAAPVVLADSDPRALVFARRNVPAGRAVESELLDAVPGPVAVIAAVPPYVPDDEADLMPSEAQWEPRRAHLGGADGLDVVRRLLDQASSRLSLGGALVLELHRSQVDAAATYARALGYRTDQVFGDDGHTAVLVAVTARAGGDRVTA